MKSHRYPAIMGDERPDDGGMLFLASVSFPRSLPETFLYAKPVAVTAVTERKEFMMTEAHETPEYIPGDHVELRIYLRQAQRGSGGSRLCSRNQLRRDVHS
jgi:hypothetical protein